MTARHAVQLMRLLAAALGAGALAAAPSLAQVRAAGPGGGGAGPRPAMSQGQRGAAVGPRQQAPGGRRAPGGSPAGFRGRGPGGLIVVDRGGSLLNRGAPMAVRTGNMGGNEAPFALVSPAQLRGNEFIVRPAGSFVGSTVRTVRPPFVVGDDLRRRGGFLARDDDDFRFVADLGGGNVWIGDDPVWAPAGYWRKHRGYRRYWYPQSAYFPGTLYYNAYPYGYYGSYANSWPVYSTDDATIDPYGNPIGPQYVQPPAPPAPPRQLTPPERAQRALLSGAPEGAVNILREYAGTNPDDTDAVRQLAVALLESGEPAQAVAVMAMAYDKDPTLASRPLAAPLLFRDSQDLRQALSRAVTYANRVNTSSSWLLVAALMQAEGRDAVARRMIERASGFGLSERIAEPMRTALGAESAGAAP